MLRLVLLIGQLLEQLADLLIQLLSSLFVGASFVLSSHAVVSTASFAGTGSPSMDRSSLGD